MQYKLEALPIPCTRGHRVRDETFQTILWPFSEFIAASHLGKPTTWYDKLIKPDLLHDSQPEKPFPNMPSICTGPGPSHGCSDSTSMTNKTGLFAAVDAVRTFIDKLKERGMPSSTAASPSRSIKTEEACVKAAQDYMTARIAGRNDDVVGLVTDDVELVSSRDGRIVGKSQFREYIHRVKPTGSWKPAKWNRKIGKAEILGSVKILMVNVGVVAHFGFDRRNRIREIYVGTRRKAPQQ